MLPNPQNAVKFRVHSRYRSTRSTCASVGREMQLAVATKDCCAPRANAHYRQVLLAACGKKHLNKRGSGPFCTETLATWLLASCLATVVAMENRRTSSLFVLYLVSARLQCLQHCFRRCCVAEGLSDKHKSSNGHTTGVVPNSLAEPWACARWT